MTRKQRQRLMDAAAKQRQQQARREEAEMAKLFRAILASAPKVLKAAYLPMSALMVDPVYQRGHVPERKLRQMVKGFKWEAFGALLIGRRSDGTYWIVDGQQRRIVVQRMAAFAQRDGLDPKLLCTVFDSRGQQHEAEIFHLINGNNRTGLAPSENFRAAVVYCADPQHSISKFLDTLDLSVGIPHGSMPNVVGFTDTLVKTWTSNEEACKAALRIQQEVCGTTEGLVCSIHKGLWYILNRGIRLDGSDVKKLVRAGGKQAIMSRISGVQAACKITGRPHTNICALAIADLLGKGKLLADDGCVKGSSPVALAYAAAG